MAQAGIPAATGVRPGRVTEGEPAAPRRPRRGLGSYIVMSILAIFFLVPLLFMFVGSLKPNDQVVAQANTWRALIPTDITFQDYINAFNRANFGRLFFNSVLITTVVVVGGIVVNSLFGYALARMRFPGRTLLTAVVIALIIIPFQAIAIPLLYMMAKARWLDTYYVQMFPFIASPFFTYLFYTFFLTIPKDLEEAARVDGAGPFTTFWQIIVPLARPVYATVAILSFLFSWGELLWPVLVTRGTDVRPLPMGLSEFQTLPPISWGDIMAFAVMMTLPLLLIFLAFQDAFVKSVARSGIKG